MSKEQTPITAEVWLIKNQSPLYDLALAEEINCAMEQYAQAKVLEERNKNKKEFLEALEVEVKDAFIEGQSNNSDNISLLYHDNYYNTAKNYYETEVKPNYE